jgi:hypothetical protein
MDIRSWGCKRRRACRCFASAGNSGWFTVTGSSARCVCVCVCSTRSARCVCAHVSGPHRDHSIVDRDHSMIELPSCHQNHPDRPRNHPWSMSANENFDHTHIADSNSFLLPCDLLMRGVGYRDQCSAIESVSVQYISYNQSPYISISCLASCSATSS